MATRETPWPDGTPCWFDVMVDDLDAARAFYSDLLGWDIPPGDSAMGGYAAAMKDGRAVGGVMPKTPDMAGVPSVWMTYFAAADIEATTSAAKAAGATFMVESMDIATNGRMSWGTDPVGAAFGLWQAGTMIGVEVWDETGVPCWAELHTKDSVRAKAFYTAVFGFEYEAIGGDAFGYSIAKRPGETDGVGGVVHDVQLPEGMPPYWLVWFSVADCDATTDQAASLGSTVFMPPADSAFGRMSVVQGPQGEVFGLIDTATRVG